MKSSEIGSAAHVDRSAALFERAQRIIPGGVNSPVRAFSAVGGTPRFIDRARGPYLYDVDGVRYIDFVMSWGPLIHGHAFPPALLAIERAAAGGTTFGAPTENEILLAELIAERMPSVEMVRLVNSGTEATMSAIRLARGYTGRDLIVKFAGNYHGHADSLLVQVGSGSLTLGVPSSPGVPAAVASSTAVLPFNDKRGLRKLFAECGSQIAAVVVEPIAGNMGVVPPVEGYLALIQELCRGSGSIFLCDEVITGFRVARGGAQEIYSVQPDITTLGKILGGGLPIGAYGGRREIMRHVAPVGPVYQAGTLSGNPLATTAGLANLEPLSPSFYQALQRSTGRLEDGLRDQADRAGLPVTVNAVTGMLTVFFTVGEVNHLVDAQRCDTTQYARFFHAMLAEGVYLPPSQFEAWMISAAHTDEIIDQTIEAAGRSFARVSDQ